MTAEHHEQRGNTTKQNNRRGKHELTGKTPHRRRREEKVMRCQTHHQTVRLHREVNVWTKGRVAADLDFTFRERLENEGV
jgi:hypothetical protein